MRVHTWLAFLIVVFCGFHWCTIYNIKARSKHMYELNILNFYLSWACNHKCIHCWVEGSPENVEHLEVDLCIDILEQALPLGLKSIKVTGGEPLLYMDTVEAIFDWCNNHNINVIMETNGSLLNEAFIRRYLKDKNVDLSISLNGYNCETHDQFVASKGSFNKVLANLAMLNAFNIKFQLITSIFKDNVLDIEKVVEICKDYNPIILKINPIVSIGRGNALMKEDRTLNYRDIKELVPVVDELSKKYTMKIFLHVPPSMRSFSSLKCFGVNVCSYLNMLSLLPDKSLALCGYGGVNEDTIWGNYTSDFNLKDFWDNNEGIRLLRSIDAIDGICDKCVHKKVCRGDCRAIAVSHFNKWDAPNPNCQNLYNNGCFPKSRLISG